MNGDHPGYNAPIEEPEPWGIGTAVMAPDDLIRLSQLMDHDIKHLRDRVTLMCNTWETVQIEPAKDEEILVRWDNVTAKITARVEKDVTPDIVETLTGALRWRAPERLTAIKTEPEKDTKPELLGRQRGLFLPVGDTEGIV